MQTLLSRVGEHLDAQSLDSAIAAAERISAAVNTQLEQGCLEELRDSILPRVAHWGEIRPEDLGKLVHYDGRHSCSWPQKVESATAAEVRLPRNLAKHRWES